MSASGGAVPPIGFGVYQMTDAQVCEQRVAGAIDAGYRLIDTATVYRNERAVGRGVRAAGIARDEVVVTTKLWPSDFGERRAAGAIERSRARLDVGPIDLLLHQPVGDVLGAWRAMETAVERGEVRMIGVSNFTAADLQRLLPAARIRPVVDQVELHPYWQQRELLPFLADEGITPQAWYPLGHGSGQLSGEPAIAGAARAHGKSVVQVILRWHVQSGFIPLPKSADAIRDVFKSHRYRPKNPRESGVFPCSRQLRQLSRTPTWHRAATSRGSEVASSSLIFGIAVRSYPRTYPRVSRSMRRLTCVDSMLCGGVRVTHPRASSPTRLTTRPLPARMRRRR